MGRSTVSGPATGGIIAIPLYNKRATQAGARDEDGVLLPTAGRIVSASGHSTGTAGSTYTIQLGGTTDGVSKTSAAAGANVTSNKGAGNASLTSPATNGFAWTDSIAVQGARQAARGSAVEMNCTGIGPAAFGLSEHILFAVQGHRYDNAADD